MQIPPFKVLAAALHKTTEHLAGELAQPSDLAPSWSELEWAIARAVAAMQGISTLLANNLRWQGPPAWQAFLAEQREHCVRRDARIAELLRRIDAATRAAGISCVALKGAALRAFDLYRPGERPMSDIDLLVSAGDGASIAAVMRQLDYVEAAVTRRHAVYAPRDERVPKGFGEHVDNPLKIEVHTAVAEDLPVRSVDITSRLESSHARPGLNPYPSVAALLLHLLLHAANNMRAHALRQIQIHDIAALSSRFKDADWQALFGKPHGVDGLWWAFPPFALAARYYPGSIPDQVLRAVRAVSPRALRFATDRQTLTDVSWSNLRIHAFPGIAWSRTPLDALRFIRSRILPSRVALTELEIGVRAQPLLEQIPWYGLSHGKRIPSTACADDRVRTRCARECRGVRHLTRRGGTSVKTVHAAASRSNEIPACRRAENTCARRKRAAGHAMRSRCALRADRRSGRKGARILRLSRLARAHPAESIGS
jgi:predicted nucleotidyltransferase